MSAANCADSPAIISKFVIIGGGIAGVTCAETLTALCPDEEVLLIAASPLIKAVTNFIQISKTLETFDVEERSIPSFQSQCANVTVIQSYVHSLDSQNHTLKTIDGQSVQYDKLCICTGGKPKLIIKDNPYVLGIRDTESVQEFQKKLSHARRIIVIGNGGIATELVYEVEGCEVIWAIKDKSISSTYIDAGAAKFILPRLDEDKTPVEGPLKRHKYTVTGTAPTIVHHTPGGALGPDWAEKVTLTGNIQSSSHRVHVEYGVEMKTVWTAEEFRRADKSVTSLHTVRACGDDTTEDPDGWPVYIELTNGRLFGCDLVVSATGVIPNTDPFIKANNFDTAEDGGLKVNGKMKTSMKDVYAAGDVCTACWELSSNWQQMRLWSQARQMGAYAAKCILADSKGEDVHMDFCFELFAHVTKFFNHKVVLLGKFNGHGLGDDYEILLRVTEGKEYVKVVMHQGKMCGAILIGETDLEETFENLILNQLDLTHLGEDLLHPGVDLEDYFD